MASKPLTMDIFGRQYIWNLFSHNSAVDAASGYNEEERKVRTCRPPAAAHSNADFHAAQMIFETRKIFGVSEMAVSATCVRVPVLRAHCEAVNLTFEGSMTEQEARNILSKGESRAAAFAAPPLLLTRLLHSSGRAHHRRPCCQQVPGAADCQRPGRRGCGPHPRGHEVRGVPALLCGSILSRPRALARARGLAANRRARAWSCSWLATRFARVLR